MAYQTSHPWYIELPTHDILNPFPWYIEPTSNGILNLYPWYIEPSIDLISSPLHMVFRPPTQGILNHVPMVY